MTALYWINNAGEWKQFVRNRVDEILRLSDKSQWHHCPGAENPADLGSRGVTDSKLKSNDLWWRGPKWLGGPIDTWPSSREVVETVDNGVEVKKAVVMNVNTAEVYSLQEVINAERESQQVREVTCSNCLGKEVYS